MAGEPVLWVLTILGVLAFAAAVASLVDGLRFRRHGIAARVWDRNAFLPPALVLVPCRGTDADLESNLDAILSQEYPRRRVVFCVDRLDDPAVPVIERVRARHPVPSEIATAADSPATGGAARRSRSGLCQSKPGLPCQSRRLAGAADVGTLRHNAFSITDVAAQLGSPPHSPTSASDSGLTA